MAIATESTSLATYLECPSCGRQYNIHQQQTYATCCNQPLVTRYHYHLNKEILHHRKHTLWRYVELLPVFNKSNIVSLGEGFTPLLNLFTLSRRTGVNVLLKDESMNPTGSFKARGISVAVSKAKELGVTHVIMPTAGNAGGALSAYCAKAGIKATVIMPAHTPSTLKEECNMFGAELILVNGLLDDCAKLAKQLVEKSGGFDMSTLKEPYRLEGKKTIGYEIAEQLNWRLPDVIIYPTGGGTGLIGMWKAFLEMQRLGWIGMKLPRMVIIQTKNCAPMIQLFENGTVTENIVTKPSSAYGLVVPKPFAKDLMLDVLQQSKGTALAVTEEEIDACMHEVALAEGLLLSPEGSATYMGLKKLVEQKWIKENEEVLLFNTCSWYKYR